MLHSIFKFIGNVPYVTSKADRIKYSALRTIIFALGFVNLVTSLFMSTDFVNSAHMHNQTVRLIWYFGVTVYFIAWYVLSTRYYKLSIWIWSLQLAVSMFALLPLMATPISIFQIQLFLVMALIAFSVYLPKTQLYSIGLLFYLSGLLGMYRADMLRADLVTLFSFASVFCVGTLELIQRIREAEAKEAETTRARALHSSRLSTLGETTAFLVHEVSSPLTVLAGHLELIEKRENFEYHISKMKNALDRAIDFITSVKRMVRAIQPNEYEVVQLSEILKMVSDLVEPSLRSKRVRLEFDYAEDVELKCRPAEIAQVIINLINNSADAIGAGSERWIRVLCKQDGKCFDIEISDPGEGIDSTVALKVMDPFFTTKSKGSGIGLSIAQQVAAHHDGRVDITSLKNPTSIRLRVAITPTFVRSGNRSISAPHSPRARRQPEI